MKRPSTENFLGIEEQPDNFCGYIDPVLAQFNRFDKIAKEEYEELKDSSDIDSDIYRLGYIELPDAQIEKFTELKDQMLNWFKGWLILYEKSLDQEKNKNYRSQLVLKYMECTERYDKWERHFEKTLENIEKFKDELECTEHYFNKIVDEYNRNIGMDEVVDKDNQDYIETIYLKLSIEIEDIERSFSNLEDEYETLRDIASTIREYVNDEIKELAKVQMFRVENQHWYAFLAIHMNPNALDYYKERSKCTKVEDVILI